MDAASISTIDSGCRFEAQKRYREQTRLGGKRRIITTVNDVWKEHVREGLANAWKYCQATDS